MNRVYAPLEILSDHFCVSFFFSSESVFSGLVAVGFSATGSPIEAAIKFKNEKNYELMVENFKLALLQENFQAAYELGLYYHHLKNYELMEQFMIIADENNIYFASRFLCIYYYQNDNFEARNFVISCKISMRG